MGLPLTPTHWLYWTAALAFVMHAIHVPRMPTYWELQIQQYMPWSVPKQVFFPLYLIALACHAGFGALFFTNAVPDPLYDWAVVLWFIWLGLVMLAIWFFATPVSFWPAGPLATVILGINVALLVLAVVYGDTRAWLIGFEVIAIAWALVATIFSWFVTVKLGPKFGEMKAEVARMTNETIEKAGGTSMVETRTQVPSARIASAPLLKDQSINVPLSALQRRTFNA